MLLDHDTGLDGIVKELGETGTPDRQFLSAGELKPNRILLEMELIQDVSVDSTFLSQHPISSTSSGWSECGAG